MEQFHIDGTLERRYVLDRIKGTVSFPDGRNGLIPPDGTEATIQIQYSITEAEKGNLSEGKITMLESDIGFISEVSNYEATTGGLKQETIDEAIKRRAASLRHRDRAVTAKDYEDLAKEATRNIIRAKCFSNYNAEGKKQYGAVTLVLLQRDFEKGRKYFDGIREQVIHRDAQPVRHRHQVIQGQAALSPFNLPDIRHGKVYILRQLLLCQIQLQPLLPDTPAQCLLFHRIPPMSIVCLIVYPNNTNRRKFA